MEKINTFPLYDFLEKYSYDRQKGLTEIKKHMDIYNLSMAQKRYIERVVNKYYDIEEEEMSKGLLAKRRLNIIQEI